MNRSTTRSDAASATEDIRTHTPPRAAGGGDASTHDHAGEGGGSGLTRVTVNLTRQAVEALEALCERTGYSKTDVINRAIQIYKVMEPRFDPKDGGLHILQESGQI